MTATERARRSDAFFRDNVSRRALCDRIAFLESEKEDLVAELEGIRSAVRDGGPIELFGHTYVREA